MNSKFLAILATFAASFIPGLEVKLGIPVGVAMGLPTALAMAVALLGNLLQVVLALWLVDWAYNRSARLTRVKRWLEKAEARAMRHKSLIQRYGWLGLAIFVVLPLPGTGVWGGVILSRLLQVPRVSVWIGVSLGVLISGILFGLGAHGTVEIFERLS